MTESNLESSEKKEPKEGKPGCIKIILFVFLVLIIGSGLFLLVYWINNRDNTSSTPTTTTKTETAKTGSNWTLTLTSLNSMTGPETKLSGEGKSTINFKMPSKDGEKFTATGVWNSTTSGTVGAGTTTGTVTGKVTVSGEKKNGKLTFTPTYDPEECAGSVSTPIGGSTSNTCDPNSLPATHIIEINISDNATASKDSATNYGLYSYDWKENWKLNSVK